MERPRNDSLEKAAGNSIIAWGIASFPMSLATGMLDCGVLFIIWAGIAVRRGSRTGSFFALIFSAIGFIGDVAVVVSAATHGIDEVGAGRAFTAAGFAVWMLLNLALLSQLRVRKSPGESAHSGNEDAASADDILLAPKGEAVGDVVFAPITASNERFPQFSLRSLFVLAILVALACAIGTRPIELNRNWGTSWSTGNGGSSTGNAGEWSVFVASLRSGRPAIGYLWRSKKEGGPTCFDGLGPHGYFLVNGQAVAPGRNFILFFNDAEDQPQRLEILQGRGDETIRPRF